MKELLLFALVGVGGTVVMDIWVTILRKLFGIPSTNWMLVGRWVSYMKEGRFYHPTVKDSDPVKNELLTGWIVHYVIGIAYGVFIMCFFGAEWINQPTWLPALTVAWVSIVAPFFIMMPAMGSGMLCSKVPNPNIARLRAVINHSVFGLGMYWTGLLLVEVLA